MPYITVDQENSGDIDIYYEDHGSGQPVVLIHGFPLDGASWEKQIPMLLDAGYRVIHYDRRGFGRSSQPVTGYDYDTFTADLNALIETLDLRDIVLAGFSMGTGEITRYLGAYGTDRVAAAALFAPLAPYLLKTDDNPEGVPAAVFEEIKQAIRDDRFAYQKDFLDNFYNMDVFGGTARASEQVWQHGWAVAVGASALGTLRCVDAWCTDFRGDVPALSNVPLLVVQGTEDRILPIDNTGRRLRTLVRNVQYHEVDGGPHNIGWTHAEVVNPLLLGFLTKQ
ncbi:alpha/beta fold hydrolase [Protofrankia coriariae]|uniref:Bromoperoxidase n=1 Tax=Protofrankia coriariae TaxID=1562887 RepID=A0ABR5EZK7_9ACTN|nr:alpha/beta hydrolase [Protofrankia coriariae]KLL09845.1 bromoperoxidase [Protofrankia coriariae]